MNVNIMLKQNKISIITASFQSESTIKDTLKSVNIQSYPYIDHIIIDGASTDNTLEMVQAYGKRVVHVTSEKDSGIFDAYNKGIKLSKGEIIGILNSDDFYATPDVIECVMHVFTDSSVDAVYADLVYVDKKNTDKVIRVWKSNHYSKNDFVHGFSPPHPTLFLRKSVYERFGNFDPNFRLAGDYEYMLRVFHVHEVKSVYLPRNIIRMRTGGATGGTWTFIKKQNIEILSALNTHKVKIKKIRFFANKIFNRINQYVRAVFY